MRYNSGLMLCGGFDTIRGTVAAVLLRGLGVQDTARLLLFFRYGSPQTRSRTRNLRSADQLRPAASPK